MSEFIYMSGYKLKDINGESILIKLNLYNVPYLILQNILENNLTDNQAVY